MVVVLVVRFCLILPTSLNVCCCIEVCDYRLPDLILLTSFLQQHFRLFPRLFFLARDVFRSPALAYVPLQDIDTDVSADNLAVRGDNRDR